MVNLFLFFSLCSLAPVTCTAEEFQCADKQCIDQLWHCDGDPDCNDQSDESNCTSNNVTICSSESEWQCHTGEQCIHSSWKCDNDEDCLDGSDEIDCKLILLSVISKKNAQAIMFTCVMVF